MKRLIIILVLLVFCSLLAEAQIPRTLSYQGVLADSLGNPKSDGTYTLTFRLYETKSGGSEIWMEQKKLELKRGLFTTILGDSTSFPDSVKFDKAYWLGIQEGTAPELSPRIPLTSVGYSMNALRADTANISMVSLNDQSWVKTDSNISFSGRNVGIGTTNPTNKLTVAGSTQVQDNLQIDASGTGATPILDFAAGYGNNSGVLFRGNGSSAYYSMALRVDQGVTSTLTIGESNFNPNPDLQTGWTDLFTFQRDNLQIAASGTGATPILDFAAGYGNKSGVLFRGNGSVSYQSLALRLDQGPTSRLTVGASNYNPNPDLQTGWNDLVTFQSNGYVGIGTTTPQYPLDVNGRTRTSVLEITGSDFAEPFEISQADSLPLGSLVVIDPKNPGKLKQAIESYDKRVAGVISGAGGIYPGIMVTKESKSNNIQYVAMTGKVYALATATNGAIEPGNLLTTSSVPGHAMKATDKEKSFGTIIGKAMSALNEGTGLVLVLVNLQ